MQGVDQVRRRVLAGEPGHEFAGFGGGEGTEGDPSGQAAAVEVAERAGQGPAHVGVAVGGHDQARQGGEQRRQVLDEQEGGVVGPLQVVEDDQQGTGPGQAGQDVAQAPEQVVPFLVRGQLERQRQVGKASAQLGQEPGDLRGGVAEDVGHERLGTRCRRQCRFEDLDDGGIGSGAGHLVAVADEDLHTARGRLGGGFFRQPRLADSRLAADEHHAAGCRPGALQRRRQRGPLRHPSDERCPLGLRAGEGRAGDGGVRGDPVGRRAGARQHGRRRRRGQGRVVAEDSGLEVGERRCRVDTEFLSEQRPEPLIGPERLGLAPKVVQRHHQLSPGPFPQRVGGDVGFETGQGLGRPAAGQLGLDEFLDGVEAGLVEVGGLGSEVTGVDDVDEGGAPPQLQCSSQGERGGALRPPNS